MIEKLSPFLFSQMKAYVYILYSAQLNRYYIGSTELNPQQRLRLHLSRKYGNTKYTAKADDWEIYLSFQARNINHARKIENYIKKMKSRNYIERLKNELERINWLLENI